jgi:hypothetical protein
MYRDYKSNVHPNSKYHSLLGIYPVWLGWLTALPDFECKPRVLNDCFVIFVSAGSGIFRCKGKDYPLEKNDAYFLFPGVVHYYKTDPANLLELWWVGFNGPNAGRMLKDIGVNPDRPILKNIHDGKVFSTICEIVESAGDLYSSDLLKTAGNIYKLFGLLMENCSECAVNHQNEPLLYTKPIMRAVHFFSPIIRRKYPSNRLQTMLD